MFLGRRKDDSDEDVFFLESDAANVASSIAAGRPFEYYNIVGGDGVVTLVRCEEKTGPRKAAPAREVIQIVAGGNDVAEIEVVKKRSS